eukprot:TRINITY_DN27899_c0_g1_i1.p1 TRINITY_DN27899_c0_g1~~TRINITY_DN27899_c0_g1_i1.p1  ORF type:complete len:398 (-),score=42.08 TRINITY_DN27899_c0_g1_i1:548-1648(-)
MVGLVRGTSAGSCGGEVTKKYHSQTLLQMSARHSTVFNELFPTYSIVDVNGTSGLAMATLYDADPTVNKTIIHKMINPSHYLAADGSLRLLARITHDTRCACPEKPKQLCYPDPNDGRDGGQESRLVSCSAGSSYGCTFIGPFADPHAFQYRSRPWAFVNNGSWEICRPILLDLISFESFELKVPGMNTCEKNWQAFEHEGELYFSQWVMPNHKVIRCNVSSRLVRNDRSVACEYAFNSSTSFSLDGVPGSIIQTEKVHGSTPYVDLDSDHLLAAAHIHDEDLQHYWHMFFAIQREPPFAIVANTPWFQFLAPDGYQDAEWAGIQFAGGLMRTGDDILVSYGIGDCFSQALKLPVSDVAKALGFHG